MLNNDTLRELIQKEPSVKLPGSPGSVRAYRGTDSVIVAHPQGGDIFFTYVTEVPNKIDKEHPERNRDQIRNLLMIHKFISLVNKAESTDSPLRPHIPVIDQIQDYKGDWNFVKGFFGYSFDQILEDQKIPGCYQWYPLHDEEMQYLVSSWHEEQDDRASTDLVAAMVASGYKPYDTDRPSVVDELGQFRFGWFAKAKYKDDNPDKQ